MSGISVVPASSTASDGTHGELAQRTYRLLRDLMIRGRLPPGSRAVEAQLARKAGVSRTPVREALARLAQEGYLVPATSGRRIEYQVAPLSADAMRELWGVIGALEGQAVLSLGTMMSDEWSALAGDLTRVNRKLLEATSARPRDQDLISELQTAFHVCFMDRCAGPFLRALYDRVRPHVQRYEWAYGTQSDAPYGPSIAEHEGIIMAIARGDGRGAKELLERHWARGAERTAEQIVRLS